MPWCAARIAPTGYWSAAIRSGWADIHADDLNARFKELVGEEYTVKDLRTWHGTVLGGRGFVDADPPVNKTVIKRVESAVMKEVAEELGNTPAVARSSYVDPRVVRGLRARVDHRAGAAPRRADQGPGERQAILEKQHGAVDPQGRQGLAGHDGEPIVSQPLSDNAMR